MKSEERYGQLKGIEEPTRITVLPQTVTCSPWENVIVTSYSET